MKKKQPEQKRILPKEFWKQFKHMDEVSDYLSDLLKEGVSALLEGEMDDHLGYEKYHPAGRKSGNSRNGKYIKTLKTNYGEVPVEVPRDRQGSYDPKAVPKHQRRVSDKIAQAIIGLYSRGMTTADIKEQIQELYGVDVAAGSISQITNSVLESIREWQSRPLEPVYYVVWMDGLSIKVRHDGKVVNKTIYLVIGLTKDGKKQVLGMWIAPTESAAFWMNVLTELKARGVADILIAATDNLNGFSEAIKGVFPQTDTQLCVVHQVRNSMRYVVWKDKKAFAKALKNIYHAPTLQAAEAAMDEFEAEWGGKYCYAIKSWRNNWEGLTRFFEYPLEIRKIVYTTNIIEGLNRQIRKYTKTKSLFPNDDAAMKAVYLAIQNVERKWTNSMRNWGMILSQFMIKFEERCRI